MAIFGKGRGPLVADRRYPAQKATTGAPPPRKPPAKKPTPRKAVRKHGLIMGAILGLWHMIWRVVWGVTWRLTAVGAMILGGIVFYFYAQMPPVTDLLDGRAKGSVTMLDRDGQVYAWRGETFGGQITADTVSPYLHDAVIATEDKRFYRHFGISPRGHRIRRAHQHVRRARAAGGQRRVHHHATGGQAAVPWHALCRRQLEV